VIGGGRGKNPVRHANSNSGHFKHTHYQINPIRHISSILSNKSSSRHNLYILYIHSGDDRPWVSKHITCVWAFIKRRRERDYLAVFNSLKK